MFDAFDAPDTQSACPRRETSTHALQALVLLNSDFAVGRARALAGRILREAGGDTDARIRRAYAIVLCREPTAAELEQARGFLASQAQLLEQAKPRAGRCGNRPVRRRPIDPAEAAAWVDFALAMLNRNEFLYVP